MLSTAMRLIKFRPNEFVMHIRTMLPLMEKQRHCPNCNAYEGKYAIFCQQCRTLLNVPSEVDYFELMGYKEVELRIDLEDLSRRFKKLQTRLHPDKFVLKSESEKKLSEEWSPLINIAYETLNKPLKRYLYVLERSGKPLIEGEGRLDPTFLAEIMERNEYLAEISSRSELDEFSEENSKILNRYMEDIEEALSIPNLEEGLDLVAQMKYYDNLQNKISEVEEKLGILR